MIKKSLFSGFILCSLISISFAVFNEQKAINVYNKVKKSIVYVEGNITGKQRSMFSGQMQDVNRIEGYTIWIDDSLDDDPVDRRAIKQWTSRIREKLKGVKE